MSHVKSYRLHAYFIAMCTLLSRPSNGLVLEDLKQSDLEDKKIGYYPGSFDPIHKGHEAIVERILESKMCDFVLIYPVWGGDAHKQQEANVHIRMKMLFALFEEHPQVIVTRYTPKQLQEALTIPRADCSQYVAPVHNISFTGIIGSDTARWYINCKEEFKRKTFMAGVLIDPKYAEHTLGCCMALPAKEFIVVLRDTDKQKNVGASFLERPILSYLKLDPNVSTFSSTHAKIDLRNNLTTDLLSSPICEMIKKYELYRAPLQK